MYLPSGRSPIGSSRSNIRVNCTLCVFLFFCVILTGCKRNPPPSTPRIETTPSPTPGLFVPLISPTETIQSLPPSSPTPPARSVWLAPYLPESLNSSLILPTGYTHATTSSNADIVIEAGGNNSSPSIRWIYALVVPFPTVTDSVSSDSLKSKWRGDPVSPFTGAPLLMDENTLQTFVTQWGNPAPQAVQVLPTEELLDYAWLNRTSLAIVPFESLNPRWKVLSIEDQSPLHKDFDPDQYLLTMPFSISGDPDIQPESFNLPSTNRYPDKLTTLAMTGVTAMVRATAFTMETKGITYPAEEIGHILASTDITHISNEIPFSPDCPYPTPYSDFLVFCSNPDYIDLLKEVGTDIIELTGDHFMDYGPDATIFTLQMYDDLGWPHFGGGENADKARQPVLLEHNGNKLAFLGCNIGCQVKNEIPCDAIATDAHPGAAQCDFNWITREISSLRDEGYQVIFTFQHREYYTYTTEPILEYDFGQVAAAGATIVSGSQAHQPHGFSIDDESFIHYGLGNLFFDQYHFCADYACDDAFIDRHVFYDGKHISTELITIRFVDTAQSRLMTIEERERFLNIIFTASGW